MKLTIEGTADEIKKVLQTMQGEEHSDASESILSTVSIDANGKVTSSNPQINYIFSACGY